MGWPGTEKPESGSPAELQEAGAGLRRGPGWNGSEEKEAAAGEENGSRITPVFFFNPCSSHLLFPCHLPSPSHIISFNIIL